MAEPDAMEPFSTCSLPTPAGLHNLGANCYYNALLQALAACTQFTRAVVSHRAYMIQTATGRALYNYCRAVHQSAMGPEPVDPRHSTLVLQALQSDLRVRGQGKFFGAGQNSASEALVFLLEMVEPPSAVAARPSGCEGAVCEVDAAATTGQSSNPIAEVFRLRVRDQVVCKRCAASARRPPDATPAMKPGVVSMKLDTQYQYPFFHYDEYSTAADPIVTPEQFVAALKVHVSPVDDYKCELCAAAGEPVPAPGTIYRAYELRLVSPVLVVLFNQYAGHRRRYFPLQFRLKGNGEWLVYRLAAQVEHSGGLHSGHYWATALRRSTAGGDPAPATCNDMSCTPGRLGPTPNTYCLFYVYDHQTAA